jgi:SAM-dependent methyltransferase
MTPAARRISCLSFLILALELALIRLVPAEIKAISYFTNLLLFSSFFGLGLGCMLGERRPLHGLLPLGGILLFGFLYLSRGIVIYDNGTEVHYWLQNADQDARPFLKTPLYVAALAVFALAAIPFVALGQALARAMDAVPRLTAYSWDLAGSLLGTVLFTTTAYLGVPPWAWVTLALWLFGAFFAPGWVQRGACLAAGALFLLLARTTHEWKWSPYYFLQYEATPSTLTVWVNSSFHQEAINFDTPEPKYRHMADVMKQRFAVPYAIYQDQHQGAGPKRVLILGAGTGNDANVALQHGAESVTAVEIDPAILALGRAFNAGRPYQNPKVRTVVDDGRHYLWNTREHYDLIVFGTLDSQALLSGQANLRLENYIYTVECFKDVRAALAPGGMVAAYYSVFKPWFFGRISATMAAAFPGSLRVYEFRDNYLFNAVVMGGKDLPGFTSDPPPASDLPSTDDWPFIYMERPMISPLYLTVIGLMLALIAGAFGFLRSQHADSGGHVNFFLLGLGFTLLEAAAIVRLALVFGATWIVSAVVFSAALLTLFLANLLVMRRPRPGLAWAWGGLLGSLLVNYLLPPQLLLGLGPSERIGASVLLIGLPVFCAGVCFSTLFARQQRTGYALGINLVGAMAGGMVEYLSMLIGMRQVWLLIILVYAAALICSRGKLRGAADAAGARA